MYQLRLWIGVTVLWLLVFFNIERFHEPINIASFVYVFAGIVAAATVVFTTLRKVPLPWQASIIMTVFVIVKWALGYSVVGTALPLTITEVVVLLVTLMLATRISREAISFESSVDDFTLQHLVAGIEPATSDYSRLYREVRRARKHGRPLGLLAVSAPTDDAVSSRLLEEIQRNSLRSHVNAKLNRVVADSVSEVDLISRHEDHLVVAIPEADGAQMRQIAAEIAAVIEARLGWKADVGVALFPSQEVTLSGLLERAERNLAERNLLEDDDFGEGFDASEMASGKLSSHPVQVSAANAK